MYKSLFLISLALLLVSCDGSKQLKAEPDQKLDVYLLIGQGGGVTGAYEEYKLYGDGRVEAWGELQKLATPNGKISSEKALDIFNAWHELDRNGLMPFEPGNLNYRISYVEGNRVEAIGWSDRQKIDAALLRFYNNTFKILRNAK